MHLKVRSNLYFIQFKQNKIFEFIRLLSKMGFKAIISTKSTSVSVLRPKKSFVHRIWSSVSNHLYLYSTQSIIFYTIFISIRFRHKIISNVRLISNVTKNSSRFANRRIVAEIIEKQLK